MKKNSKKVAIIIQARITSTRLPGKVLMDIEDKPMLWHILNRLKFSKKLNDIILAIPNTKENDILEEFANEIKVKYYRGSEEDVLLRYYETAKAFKVNVIIRITADCPLIDPKIVDLLIERHLNSKADYTSNVLKRTFPRGLDTEVFNFDVLEKAHREAKENHQREHVTPYIWSQPELFRLQNVEAERKLARSEFRLTVDTKEDLQLMQEIYKHLYKPERIFYTRDVIDLLDRYPKIAKINENIQQKSLKT